MFARFWFIRFGSTSSQAQIQVNFDSALDSLSSADPTSYTLSWFCRKRNKRISYWPNWACTVPAWSWVVSRKWKLVPKPARVNFNFSVLHSSVVWLTSLQLYSSTLHAYSTGSQWCTGILNGIACKSSQWLNSSLKFHLHFHCESDLTFPAGTITSSFLKNYTAQGI